MNLNTATDRGSWIRRHPGLTLLGFNLAVFLMIGLVLELLLRIYIPYNPGYYISVGGTSREVEYPYGTIKINEFGFPDDDFDTTKSQRVGYFGDSVTYGVGAGYGYRFSEILADAYPSFEHMNFGGIGLSISAADIERCAALAQKFDLDTAFYFFNLNDIIPDRVVSGENATVTSSTKYSVLEWLDWFRGKSFLYTYVRTAAKNFLESRGVGFHGYTAFELYPNRETKIIQETVQRIEDFQRALAAEDVRFVLAILPYEMQISANAEQVYADLGIEWEEGFIGGRTQELVLESLEPNIERVDLREAFIDLANPTKQRAQIQVGQYFVYNKGDKLDWNHPNRAGHRKIAEYLARVGILGPPKS